MFYNKRNKMRKFAVSAITALSVSGLSMTLANADVYLGSQGNEVAAVQQRLSDLGFLFAPIDGDFGPVTETAVINFQTAYGLYVDGVVGPITIAALGLDSSASEGSNSTLPSEEDTNINNGTNEEDPGNNNSSTSEENNSNETTESTSGIGSVTIELSFGSTGNEVAALQSRLTELGYNVGNIDGDFGNMTYYAVIAFQQNEGLYVDGIVGPLTLAKLNPASSNPATQLTYVTLNGVTIYGSVSQGDYGSEVTALQSALSSLGYYTHYIDGQFGGITAAAVSGFQSANGLPATGTADGNTLKAINSALYSSPSLLTYGQALAKGKNALLGNDLFAAYNYTSTFSYLKHYPDVDNYIDMVEECAVNAFTTSFGDCYCSASAFCYLARDLGYDAHVVIGQVPLMSGGVTIHAWVEIDHETGMTVYDPRFLAKYGYGGYNFNYGDTGTYRYEIIEGRIN